VRQVALIMSRWCSNQLSYAPVVEWLRILPARIRLSTAILYPLKTACYGLSFTELSRNGTLRKETQASEALGSILALGPNWAHIGPTF